MVKGPISIVGGGLAGLSLGIGLRKRGVPVRLYEAGKFPRHRVCGEFISGIKQEALQHLGIGDLFDNVLLHREVRWYRSGEMFLRAELPVPALGVSRYQLDAWMVKRLRSLGGEVIESERVKTEVSEGWVLASGRKSYSRSPWLGLKMHIEGLELEGDLEMHLGDKGYVGLSRVDSKRVNVCGLFVRDRSLTTDKKGVFASYLKKCGLTTLEQRLQVGQLDPESLTAISCLEFGWQKPKSEFFEIGDRLGVIPPFTGNGMSMAMEGAADALDELTAYWHGSLSWEEANTLYRIKVLRHFKWRMLLANCLHQILIRAFLKEGLVAMGKLKLLPFGLLLRSVRL